MRRLTWIHALALALMLVAAVPTAFANGTASSTKLRISLAELPTSVHPGQQLKGVLTFENLTADYQHLDIQYMLATPLGNALIRSSSRDVGPNFKKTLRSVFTVSSDAKPGNYRLIVNVTNNNQTVTVTHDFTVN